MSKITCKCGNKIADSTDSESWKARLIADQDYFTFRDLIENKTFEEQNQIFHKYLTPIFECYNCGNIVFFKKIKDMTLSHFKIPTRQRFLPQ